MKITANGLRALVRKLDTVFARKPQYWTGDIPSVVKANYKQIRVGDVFYYGGTVCGTVTEVTDSMGCRAIVVSQGCNSLLFIFDNQGQLIEQYKGYISAYLDASELGFGKDLTEENFIDTCHVGLLISERYRVISAVEGSINYPQGQIIAIGKGLVVEYDRDGENVTMSKYELPEAGALDNLRRDLGWWIFPTSGGEDAISVTDSKIIFSGAGFYFCAGGKRWLISSDSANSTTTLGLGSGTGYLCMKLDIIFNRSANTRVSINDVKINITSSSNFTSGKYIPIAYYNNGAIRLLGQFKDIFG